MPSSDGLIYAPETYHLDHLAPLCAILESPLIVTEKLLLKQAQEIYPFVDTPYLDCLELPFSEKLSIRVFLLFVYYAR